MCGDVVWACEDCSYTHGHECGPTRRWGGCPGDGLPAAATSTDCTATPTADPAPAEAEPPTGLGTVPGGCTWERTQVYAASRVSCNMCRAHRKRGSRLDRCRTCRAWCCSHHEQDARPSCTSQVDRTPAHHVQTTLREMWCGGDAQAAGSDQARPADELSLSELLSMLASAPAPRTLNCCGFRGAWNPEWLTLC